MELQGYSVYGYRGYLVLGYRVIRHIVTGLFGIELKGYSV